MLLDTEAATAASAPVRTPPKQRYNEQVGGGYFVFRRHPTEGRVFPAKMPFEHPSLDSAMAEASRLQSLHGGTYDVFGRVATVTNT